MRLPGVADGKGGLFARLAFAWSRRRHGLVLDPLRIYAYRPRILRAVGKLFGTVGRSRELPVRLRELAMHQAARLVGCPF